MENLPTQKQPLSIIQTMAERYSMDRVNFEKTLKATVVPANVSNEQFAAFLLVANEYNLNPIVKEIYAFPAKGGGIQPIVSVDGWVRIINNHPQLDGIKFEDIRDGNNLTAIVCRIYRKDRSHPVEAIEYMSECRRSNSEPWSKWPTRMLRHKALIQAARYAFGYSGIVEPDEFERMVDVTPQQPATSGNDALKDKLKKKTKATEQVEPEMNSTAVLVVDMPPLFDAAGDSEGVDLSPSAPSQQII